MKRDPKFSWGNLGIAVMMIAGFGALAPTLNAAAVGPCCFDNDRFEGTCRVNPGKSETCQNILEYLNNPMSTGKSYCGGTSVRGGWVQVDCKTGKSVPEEVASESALKARKP